MDKIWNEDNERLSRFYLKCDVLLLADLFEKFRNNSLKNYGLCPSHYLSVPGLSCDAMFKMTKIWLELIPDLDMYIFFEIGTRSGISYISYISYNQKQELKQMIYLDANNIYGYAMSKFLSASELKWINPKEFDFNKYTSNSSKGCVLEVDLEYSKE